MLEGMKKGVGKIVMWVLGVLLIASFAVWGIGDMTGAISNPDGVATVAGQRITQREFQEQFRREMDRLRERIGEIDREQARSLGIADSTLDGMISRRLLAEQARDLGLLINDEAIVQQIRRQPAFRNALGHFDRSVYQNVLANSGISEGQYIASLRHDMQQDYLANAISGGVSAPDRLAETVYRYRNERRNTEVIKVPRAGLDKAPTPSEQDLAAYLSANEDSFMAPEYRQLSILYLNPEEVAKELSPSEDRIREEYEYRLPALTIPERRRLEQILVRDEAKAKQTHGALREGRTFDAVSKDVAGERAERVDLGLIARDDLLPDLADAAFALDQGGFTQPLKSPLGWHIIRVVEIQPGREPSLEEVRDEIAKDIAREMALDDLVKRANRIEDATAGGASMEEAADEIGARIRKVEPVDPALKLRAGTPVAGLPGDSRFIEIAFSLEEGAASRLTESGDGGYFMVRVDDVIAPAKRPLDQVRNEVERAWKQERLDVQAKKAAEEIRDAAKGGTPLKEIASGRNLAVQSGKPVSRFATGTDTFVPRELIASLFEARKGDVVMAQTVDGYAVARLIEVLPAEPERGNEEFARLKETLTSAIANDLLQEYTRALRGEYDVSINRAALESFFATQP